MGLYFNVLIYFQEILDRTGYSLDVTTGQRKYGGPPPDMDESSQPGAGHEVGDFNLYDKKFEVLEKDFILTMLSWPNLNVDI